MFLKGAEEQAKLFQVEDSELIVYRVIVFDAFAKVLVKNRWYNTNLAA